LGVNPVGVRNDSQTFFARNTHHCIQDRPAKTTTTEKEEITTKKADNQLAA
jgi:hypothetical protein